LISSSRTIDRARPFLLAILLLGSLAAPGAASARTWPQPKGYVSDFAGVVDEASRDSTEAIARELREKTGAELAVVTLQDLGGEEIDPVAVDLYKAWGIGTKGKDEGVLILLAVKERRVRIEVGYGLEGILPDGLCGSIIRHVMAPELSQGLFGPGLLHGAAAVVGVIAKDRGVAITGSLPLPTEEEEPSGRRAMFFMAAILIAILWSVLTRSLSSRRGWRGPRGYGGMFGGFGGMGGGFGGGGGGGFGGFGGGGSGGGGASGGF